MQQISLRAPVKFYMYKFCDHTTHLTKFWSNLTLKCCANTFVKVDAQIGEEYRRTIFYLQGYSDPSQETE